MTALFGFAGGGLMSGMTDFLPLWVELLVWGWLGASVYVVLLAGGYLYSPWLEEHGWRW
jgi:hypothetical protein